MLSIEEIQKEVLELEARDTTYINLQRLEPLYVALIYDLLSRSKSAPEPRQVMPTSESEFMQVAKGKSVDAVLTVVDELMDAVKVLHPKMYAAVIQKLNN